MLLPLIAVVYPIAVLVTLTGMFSD